MSRSESAGRHNRLRQLRAFCQAAQTGSISKAAERLFLSQPSVSLLIKGLEEDLQTMLFERRGPRIELTPAGQILLETAAPLVEGMDHLPELFAARLGEVNGGSLDIAAGESTILYLLPEFLQRYTEQYSQVRVHLHNVTGRDGLKMLRAGEVDFAVGSMIDVPDDIVYAPIFSYEPMLITALDHPLAKKKAVTLEDISPCGLILPPRHLSTWHIVDLVFHQHGLDYNVVLEAGGWEVIKKFVEMGLGVSIVTSICLTGNEALAAKPLSRYFPKRSYGVVMRRGQFVSPQAHSFLETMDPKFFERDELHGAQGRRGSGRSRPQAGGTDFMGHDKSLS